MALPQKVISIHFVFVNQYRLHLKSYGQGIVFNATFNNISVISWRSVLLMEETGVPGEKQRPAASHWQTLSHNVVSSTPRLSARFDLTTFVVIGTDWIGTCSYKPNYHAITATPAFEKNGFGTIYHWQKSSYSVQQKENKSKFYAIPIMGEATIIIWVTIN